VAVEHAEDLAAVGRLADDVDRAGAAEHHPQAGADERIVVDELPLVSDSVVRPLDSELARLSDSRLVADVDRPVVEAEEVVDVA